MNAFSYGTSNQIDQNIKALFHRVKAVSRTPLTHDEFSALFIPTEHREKYTEMAKLAHCGNSQYIRFTWGATVLSISLRNHDGQNPPPIPRGMVLQHDAPPELVERINHWVSNGGDVSGDFGRVRALFKFLNEHLTKGQIRFVWPSILTILGANPILSETLKDLQDVKVPSKAPELPRGLLAICRKTAGTLATSSLIPSDIEAPDMGAGFIEVAEGQQYDELGLGDFMGLT